MLSLVHLAILALVIAGVVFSVVELILRHEHIRDETDHYLDVAAEVDAKIQPVVDAVKSVADPADAVTADPMK